VGDSYSAEEVGSYLAYVVNLYFALEVLNSYEMEEDIAFA